MNRAIVPNAVFLFMLGILAVQIPQGIWNLNPLWIALFARVQGLAFTGIHFTSIYALIAVTLYLVIRDRKTVQPYKWVLIIFGSAGIHEWALYAADYYIKGGMLVAWQDGIWFAAFMGLGFLVADKRQREYLLALGGILVAVEFAYVQFFFNSDLQLGQYTVSSVTDNLIEVLSWLVIPVAWLFYEPM